MNRLARGLVVLVFTAGFTVADQIKPTPAGQQLYLRRMQSQIDDLSARLRKLDAHAVALPANQKVKFQDAMQALWRKEKLARVRLEALHQTSAGDWPTLRRNEDTLVIALNKSYRYVVNHYDRKN